MKRRDFIDRSGKLAISAGILTFPQARNHNMGSMGTSFLHHVFFWLKEPLDKEKAARFEKALLDLVSINSIRQYHIGKPAETRRPVIDSSYQYSLLTVFNSKAEHDSYQVHPAHDAFRVVAEELAEKVFIYDSVNI